LYDGIGELFTNTTSRRSDRDSETRRSFESSSWIVKVSWLSSRPLIFAPLFATASM